MAGTWTSQNKVLPGVYIRFTSNQGLGLTVGERGTVTICEPMSWGPVGQVMTVEAGSDTTPFCGYDITNPAAMFLQQIFLGTNRTDGANTVLLYRPTASGSAQATATTGVLTATALYPGVRGNDITVVVTEEVDAETFTVSTVVDGSIVDEQTNITNVSDLVANAWVTWSGTGAVTATTGTALTGGLDGTVESAAYSTYLTAIEPYSFDVMIYDGNDPTVQTAMLTFIKSQNDDNGIYCQLVGANFTNPDTRYVINVMSPVTFADGTELTMQQVTWWAGGALAGAKYNESLTYANYPNAVSTTMMTTSQMIAALNAGQFILASDNGRVYIVQDIDSLVTYTTDITEVYRYNRTIRLCNTIANDIHQQFADNFLGVVNNNEAGRAVFQGAIVGYLLDIQNNQGIQNFEAEDVQVLPGEAINAILVNLAIQPVGSVEKIYVTISMDV
jgi:hypothetical protein